MPASKTEPPPSRRVSWEAPTKAKAAERPEPASSAEVQKYKEALDGFTQVAQFGCIAFGQFSDAGAIGLHAPKITQATAELATQDKRIAKSIEMLTKTGPYAALISAAMPLVFQILANHKIVPADKLTSAGVVPPEVLEANVKSALAEQQMEALKQQQDAESKLADMRDQMAAANGSQERTETPEGTSA